MRLVFSKYYSIKSKTYASFVSMDYAGNIFSSNLEQFSTCRAMDLCFLINLTKQYYIDIITFLLRNNCNRTKQYYIDIITFILRNNCNRTKQYYTDITSFVFRNNCDPGWIFLVYIVYSQYNSTFSVWKLCR